MAPASVESSAPHADALFEELRRVESASLQSALAREWFDARRSAADAPRAPVLGDAGVGAGEFRSTGAPHGTKAVA
jgi:hypothetical protein